VLRVNVSQARVFGESKSVSFGITSVWFTPNTTCGICKDTAVRDWLELELV